MTTALDDLLQSENAREVIAFLRSRGSMAHIVGPARLRGQIMGGQSAKGPIWLDRPEDCAPSVMEKTNFIVVADDAAEETEILSSLHRRNGFRAYGLFSHIVPALLCSANGMGQGKSTRDIHRYAILCVPRSGSRYLSAVLSNRGVGAPREHIREPLACVIAKGGLGFARGIESLERFGQRNRIFGTKVISTFLIQASHGRMSEIEENVSWMVRRGYRLMHLERPLADAVISSYIAYLTKKWHFFDEKDALAKLDSLSFDDGAAWDEYIRFRAQKLILNSLARQLDIPSIAYSDIETDIEKVVSEVCDHVGVETRTLPSGAAKVPIPVATRKVSPTYRVFAERMSALLERRSADIDAATVKRLNKLAKLSEASAAELVATGA